LLTASLDPSRVREKAHRVGGARRSAVSGNAVGVAVNYRNVFRMSPNDILNAHGIGVEAVVSIKRARLATGDDLCLAGAT
jgi:hypothetical protein